MCLTETWLKNTINSMELFFDDFDFYRSDRECKRGGGVGILINKNLQSYYKSSLDTFKILMKKNLYFLTYIDIQIVVVIIFCQH